MDGRWDIEDLSALSDALKDSYAYFYVVQKAGQPGNARLEQMVADSFWNGSIPRWRLEELLYESIPDDDALKILSIRYASPGALTIAGILATLLLMAKVVKSWSDAVSSIVDTYEKVEKFF